MNWISLIAEEQLMDVDSLSYNSDVKGVIILKHSSRCSISVAALGRLERTWKLSEKETPAYFLDLLNHRDISNKIESKYNIVHQSPQILVIKNGQCVYSATHSDILASDIELALNS